MGRKPGNLLVSSLPQLVSNQREVVVRSIEKLIDGLGDQSVPAHPNELLRQNRPVSVHLENTPIKVWLK
jgi:hypothetical protein